MGDIADWMLDQAMEQEARFIVVQDEAAEHIKNLYLEHKLEWTTKAGDKINVIEMDKNHVYNTLNMLKRSQYSNSPKYQAWIKVLSHRLSILNQK